jgi:hypothetical protein
MSCFLVDGTSVSEEPAASIFRLEERLENVGISSASSKIRVIRFRLNSLYVVPGLFWVIKRIQNKTVVGIDRVRERIVGYRLVFEVFGMSELFF